MKVYKTSCKHYTIRTASQLHVLLILYFKTKCRNLTHGTVMNYLISLFTSLLVIAKDNDKPECIFS